MMIRQDSQPGTACQAKTCPESQVVVCKFGKLAAITTTAFRPTAVRTPIDQAVRHAKPHLPATAPSTHSAT